MVIALAGRRVDPPDSTTARFPLQNVPVVEQRIRDLLLARGVCAVASSAACGSDLLALAQAGALDLRRRVLLPFEAGRFRETSVVDRPGPWGPLFDRVIEEVTAAGDLIVVEAGDGDAAYAAVNEAILDHAQTLARDTGAPAAAAIVWDGRARGDDDLTELFRRSAAGRGLEVVQILTI